MTCSEDKRALRRRLRQARRGLSVSLWQQRSGLIVARLAAHAALANRERVALFWPMLERREVDLRPLHETLRQRGHELYYPYVSGTTMGFRRCDDPTQMVENPWGFAEPRPESLEAQAGQVDVIVLPALALTVSGQRLGYGAGFYDRMLQEHRGAVALGTCYEAEVSQSLPTEPHDQCVDWVITDQSSVPVAQS